MAEHIPKDQTEQLQTETLPIDQNTKYPELTDIQISPITTQFADLERTMTVLVQEEETRNRRRMDLFAILVEDYRILEGIPISIKISETPVSDHVTRQHKIHLSFSEGATFVEVRSAFEDIFPNTSERDAKLADTIGYAFDKKAEMTRKNIAFNRTDESVLFPEVLHFPHDRGLYLDDATFTTGLLDLLGPTPENSKD